MATKLIFSLGPTRLAPTIYDLAGHEDGRTAAPTEFAALATLELHNRLLAPDAPIDVAVPLLTSKVRQSANWGKVRRKLRSLGVRIARTKNIPEGDRLQDFAAIVREIARHVHDGDRLVFDVTNGFRHIPVVVLLASAFVRTVRRDVRLVFAGYGAHELQQGGISPLTDLSPVLRLVDGAQAVHRFAHLGATDPLCNLLDELQEQAAAHDPVRLAFAALQGRLTAFETLLKGWRLKEVQQSAMELLEALDLATALATSGNARAPEMVALRELSGAIHRQVAPWAGREASQEVLQYADLVHTLIARREWVPAIALLSELVVAAAAEQVAHHSGLPFKNDLHRHRDVRQALSAHRQDEFAARVKSSVMTKELLDLFAGLTPLRNSVLHAGLSLEEGPTAARELIATLLAAVERLMALDLVPPRPVPGVPAGTAHLFFGLGIGMHAPSPGPAKQRAPRPKPPRGYDYIRFDRLVTRFAVRATLKRLDSGSEAGLRAHVLLTSDARKSAMYRALKRSWRDLDEIQVSGEGREDDVLSAFNAVCSRLAPGDQVSLDLTHSLRSTVVCMLAGAILARGAHPNINLALVTYGKVLPGQGAGTRQDPRNGALLNITPIVELLDWAEAVDAFLHGAEAGLLARRLRATSHPHLEIVADLFEHLTIDIATFRYRSAMAQARKLSRLLTEVEADQGLSDSVPALNVIVPMLRDAIAPLTRSRSRSSSMHVVADWLGERDAWMAHIGVRSEILALRFAHPLGLYPAGVEPDDLSPEDLAVISHVASTWARAAIARRRKPAEKIHALEDFVLEKGSPAIRRHLDALQPERQVEMLMADATYDTELKQLDDMTQLRNHLLHAGCTGSNYREMKVPRFVEAILRWRKSGRAVPTEQRPVTPGEAEVPPAATACAPGSGFPQTNPCLSPAQTPSTASADSHGNGTSSPGSASSA